MDPLEPSYYGFLLLEIFSKGVESLLVNDYCYILDTKVIVIQI